MHINGNQNHQINKANDTSKCLWGKIVQGKLFSEIFIHQILVFIKHNIYHQLTKEEHKSIIAKLVTISTYKFHDENMKPQKQGCWTPNSSCSQPSGMGKKTNFNQKENTPIRVFDILSAVSISSLSCRNEQNSSDKRIQNLNDLCEIPFYHIFYNQFLVPAALDKL